MANIMKTFLKNLKIGEKIFFITSLIMLGVCVISMIAFYFVADVYERLIYSEAAEVLHLTSSTVDSELSKIEGMTFNISTDPRVQEDLKQINRNASSYEAFKGKEDLFNLMTFTMQQENYIYSIQIFDANGNAYTTILYNIDPSMWNFVQIARRGEGRNIWLPGQENSRMLIAVRQIREMHNIHLGHLGVVVFWIDMEKLVNRFLDFSEDKLFLILQNGEIVYSSHADLGFENVPIFRSKKGFNIQELDGKKYLVAHLASKHHPDLVYLNVLPYELISQHTEALRNTMILFFIILFMLVVLVSRKASHSITRPLNTLLKKMRQVQLGHFEIDSSFYSEEPNMDETGQLHRNFRIMLEKINELFEENYRKQLIIHETEYKALQAQINPHFLYNTLETINWMAKINQEHQIAEMVEALGNMLRRVIGKREPLVSLEYELGIVKDYIVIQKNRFNDRLDFELEIDPGLENCLVPKLTVQPIVENAIQHGLEAMRGVCRIRVRVNESSDHIVISVSDNGPGIDAQTMEDLKRGTVRSKKTGIGLTNIEERIKLMFGGQYGLDIDSEPGRGTHVTIHLPLKRSDEHVQSAAR